MTCTTNSRDGELSGVRNYHVSHFVAINYQFYSAANALDQGKVQLDV